MESSYFVDQVFEYERTFPPRFAMNNSIPMLSLSFVFSVIHTVKNVMKLIHIFVRDVLHGAIEYCLVIYSKTSLAQRFFHRTNLIVIILIGIFRIIKYRIILSAKMFVWAIIRFDGLNYLPGQTSFLL